MYQFIIAFWLAVSILTMLFRIFLFGWKNVISMLLCMLVSAFAVVGTIGCFMPDVFENIVGGVVSWIALSIVISMGTFPFGHKYDGRDMAKKHPKAKMWWLETLSVIMIVFVLCFSLASYWKLAGIGGTIAVLCALGVSAINIMQAWTGILVASREQGTAEQ